MRKKIIFLAVILMTIFFCRVSDKHNQQISVKGFGKEVQRGINNPLSLRTDLKNNQELDSEQGELADTYTGIPYIEKNQEQEDVSKKEYNEAVSLIENKVDNNALLGDFNQKQNQQALLFLENKGQILDTEGNSRPDILYTAKSAGAKVFITSSALHYQFESIKKDSTITETTFETHRFSIQLANVNPSPEVETSAPEIYTENYYNEYFPDGLTNVRSFKEITLKDIYPGIDWVIYSKGNFMEYDFIVHPGADPKQIRFRVADADSVSLDIDGNLKVETSLGEILKHAPVSYVEDKIVASHFETMEDGSFGFNVTAPKNKILRIDPYVEWGTYYGGPGVDLGNSCAVDAAGNVYLAGTTKVNQSIASGGYDNSYNGQEDAFLVKFNSSGQRLWATYYGGNNDDQGIFVAVSPSNYVYLVGTTKSTGITTPGTVPQYISQHTQSEIKPMVLTNRPDSDLGKSLGFLAKFNSGGARQWAAYYTNRYDKKNNQSYGVSCAFNADGSQVYLLEEFSFVKSGVPGWVQPLMWAVGVATAVIPGVNVAVAIALAAISIGSVATEIALEYGTSDNLTYGAQLFLLNAANGAYIADRTICGENSTRPTKAGALAVANYEMVPGVWSPAPYVYVFVSAADDRLQEQVGGADYSYTNNPGTVIQAESYQAVVVKFWGGYALGAGPTHRYYGGYGQETAKGIAVDPSNPNVVYITGLTTSTDNISTNGTTRQGTHDAFLAKLDMSTGNMIWSTYYGGSLYDMGMDVAVAPDGSVYLAGVTTSEGKAHKGYDNLYSGEGDGFLAKFSSSGELLMHTYVGGIGADLVRSIAVRDNNKVYVAGTTHSENGIARGGYKTVYNSASDKEAFLIKYTEPIFTNGKLYVREGGRGDKTGRDWNNALPELADALVKAEFSSGINEIWVAKGTYKPIYRPDFLSAGNGANVIVDNNTTVNNTKLQSFKLVNNVKVYGGFAGTEINLWDRDLKKTENESILSGALESGDAYHVVVSSGNNNTAELNGFTITEGNANGSGNIVVNGNILENDKGGGVFLSNSSPRLVNLKIKNNKATHGGGIANNNASPVIVNTLFTENEAINMGRALHNNNGSAPVLLNVTIADKTTGLLTGIMAMCNFSSTPLIRNSIVLGMIFNENSTPEREYSFVQGYDDTANGNISINGTADQIKSILFEDPFNGNYQLQSISPAVNGGSNALFPDGGNTIDLAGEARIKGGTIDMGAYERMPLACDNAIGDVVLTTQQQVNNFGVLWEECGDVHVGNLTIGYASEDIYSDITTLVPLEGIIKVQGNLTIRNNPELSSLEGLGNITALDGYIKIISNSELTDISGLNGIDPETIKSVLGVIDPDSFMGGEGLQIKNNSQLSMCNLSVFCSYLSNSNNERDIVANKSTGDCKNVQAVINSCNYPDIIYVKQYSYGNGTSWEDAFGELSDALEYARKYTYVEQIWVAAGVYRPLYSPAQCCLGNNSGRDNAFLMVKDVQIYGGFAGTETSLEERNPATNITVLSGDLDWNEMPSADSQWGDTYHIVIAAGNVGTACLDGFTLMYAKANGAGNVVVNGNLIHRNKGAGIYTSNSSPLLKNLKIKNNEADDNGAGIHNFQGSPTLINTEISNNAASYGAGVFSESPNGQNQITFVNTTITSNYSSSNGGGVNNKYNMTAFFKNCILYGNTTEGNLPNIRNEEGGTSVFSYSLIESNSGWQTSFGTDNENNIYDNPQFVGFDDGNYKLLYSSPAINAGNNDLFENLNGDTTDLAGNTRLTGVNIDLGAYEDQYLLGNCQDWTFWNGTSWSNGNPDENKKAIIDGILILNSDLTACELEVTTNGSLTIPANRSFTVKGQVVNKSGKNNFIVENNGALIQVDDIANTGEITVKRNSSPMFRLDYTLWGSPVAMNLVDFSEVSPTTAPVGEGTLWNRVYTLGETAWEQVWSSQPNLELNGNRDTTPFEIGKGYLYRAPNNWVIRNNPENNPAASYEGEFIGVPNNGSLIIETPFTFNALGNPYPSPIDADDFIDANFDTNSQQGVEFLYFWTNVNPPVDGSYDGINNWAYYSKTVGGTGVNGQFVPDDEMLIQPGQGFVTGVTGDTLRAVFRNTMRKTTNGDFFKQMKTEKHRFWLDLSNEAATFNQILVGYIQNASQGIDTGIDAGMFGYEGNAIYSIIENSQEKYVIQGRELPFTDTDVVPLGFRAVNAGAFSISLNSFDGIFEEDNIIIYLKDNFNQSQHNLKDGAYTFVSEEGIFDTRFEVVYQTTMNVESPDLEYNWIIFKQNDRFQILTSGFDLKEVSVYDMLGRKIYTSEAEGTTHHIPALGADGVYIVKITTTEGKVMSKKVK